MIRLEITCADPACMISCLNQNGITLKDVELLDGLSFRVTVASRDFDKISRLLNKKGCETSVIQKSGIYWKVKEALKRPVLLLGILLIFSLSVFLSGKVLFVQVEGSQTVPVRYILEKAEICGIRFGASRSKIRSEQVKNQLLSEIPQLQWVGVNTSGCVATISVKERSDSQDPAKGSASISSIVASRDGVIREFTVEKGTPLCQVGQAVQKGQTLVSGYTDCGLVLKGTQAKGEIYAQTIREITTVTPTNGTYRGEITRTEKKYSVIIGKKLINFYEDSGIYDTTCVKMYEQESIALPGGFSLPVILVTETWIYYDTRQDMATEADAHSWMTSYSDTYLLSQMVAGQILDSDLEMDLGEGICTTNGKYACLEMIGQVRIEEIIQNDGENG